MDWNHCYYIGNYVLVLSERQKKILQRKERLIKEKRKEKENIDYGERKDRLQRKELKITEKGKKDYMHFLFSSYFKK